MFLIVSGGDAPAPAFLKERAEKARLVIAADKGAEYCLAAGIRPGLVVGDMDSVSPEVLQRLIDAGTALKRHDPDKDKTDTQLALDEALALGARSIEMLSCIGSRIDHGLANIHLLYAAHCAGAEACILSPEGSVFLVSSSSAISGMRGATVSLLPLTMKVTGISLSGFRWPLEDADMILGDPYGISNVVTEDEARVSVREGILLVMVMGTP